MERGSSFRSLWAHQIAIDFGSSNLVIAVAGRGVVIDVPALVAIDSSDQSVVALGTSAQEMIGRTGENIEIIHPVVNGVVADFEVFEFMLRHYLDSIHQSYRVLWQRPTVVLSVVSTASEVERRAIIEAARNAGARSVTLVNESLAAALSSGTSSGWRLVLNIGGGASEAAIMNDETLIAATTIKQAGSDFTKVIKDLCRTKYGVRIGDSSARRVKHKIGNVVTHEQVRTESVVGVSGAKSQVTKRSVRSDDLTFPLQKACKPIVQALNDLIDSVGADVAEQISKQGLYICGGSAKLKGIDTFFAAKYDMPVTIIKKPRHATIKGLLSHFETTSDSDRVRV